MRQLKISQNITNREGESLERYLRDISKEPRIGVEEEAVLARRIKEGDDEALDRLTRANLRFVVSVAKCYQGLGLSLIDLINEGNVGLLTAAKRFDDTRGIKFISYAVSWIRQSILQALAEHSRLVRLPLNQVGNASKVNRFMSHFMQENERRPSNEEIAEGIGLDASRMSDAIVSSGRGVSIDAPLPDNEEASLVDFLQGDDLPDTDGGLLHESLVQEIDRALCSLPKREAAVLRLFYGINSREHNLEEIGRELNLSRERVRQLKERALGLLRSTPEGAVLKSFLG